MKNAIIIHASYAQPDAHWYPWLKQQLESQGYEVFIPHFPTPEHQSLASWNTLFESYAHHINEETLLIGHAIGCAFILRQLEHYEGHIAGCVFVAPYIEAIQHEGLNLVTATFLTQPFDWHAINQATGRVVVLGSDDDGFVGLEYMRHTAELLGTMLTIVPEAGHFTDADGMRESPAILAAVTTLQTPIPSAQEAAFSDLNAELKTAGIDMSIVTPGVLRADTDDVKDIDYTFALKESGGIETMYEDIADTINTSSAKAMADMLHEEREKEAVLDKKKKKRIMNGILTSIALVLVIVGLVLVNKARTYKPEAIRIEEATTVLPTPFRVNESVLFDISKYSSVFQARDGLQELIGQNTVPNKTVMHIYPGVRRLGVGVLATASEFLDAFESQAPTSLRDATEQTFTYGVYGGTVGQSMFLLLDITSIDRSSVGMKEWESTMAKDMLSILAIPDNVRQASLYDRLFTDEILLNTPMRVLRAPTITKQMTTEIIEKKIQEPIQHALPDETLSAITTITENEIIFSQPDTFLSGLAIGDIITADTSSLSSSFIRSIDNFVRTADSFKIVTTTLSLRDLRPDLPEGTRIIRRTDETGTLVKYAQSEEVLTTYVEGTVVPVLYYAFIGNKYIVIATGIDAIDAIIQRLGEAGM
jgi:hypothetical protein